MSRAKDILDKVETLRTDTKGSFKVKPIKFDKFKELMIRSKSGGIVLLGARGSGADEWINGVADLLSKEGISATPDPKGIWRGAYLLKTTGGRTDLALVFNDQKAVLNMGKMAMWRLRFGECSWISDYLVNYAKQH